MEPIKVIIADNQPLTFIGVTTILIKHYHKNVVISETKTKEDLSLQLKGIKPDALIIDYALFDFLKIDEISEVNKISAGTRILVLTDNQSADDIFKVLDLGIINYILKSATEQEFIEAFHATLTKRKYFCSEVLDVLLDRKSSSRQTTITGKLTLAETEIVKLIAQGLTTKEIASQKNLSFHTIITHRKNIFRKLNISNSSELLMYAMRAGIIDSTEYYI